MAVDVEVGEAAGRLRADVGHVDRDVPVELALDGDVPRVDVPARDVLLGKPHVVFSRQRNPAGAEVRLDDVRYSLGKRPHPAKALSGEEVAVERLRIIASQRS